MKTLLTDLIGIIGFVALCYGCYLQFGESTALMVGGSLLLLYALCSAGSKR